MLKVAALSPKIFFETIARSMGSFPSLLASTRGNIFSRAPPAPATVILFPSTFESATISIPRESNDVTRRGRISLFCQFTTFFKGLDAILRSTISVGIISIVLPFAFGHGCCGSRRGFCCHNRFWTTVASLGALFFNGVDLAQDVEQKSRFHLTKLILILTVTGFLGCGSCWSLSCCCRSWKVAVAKWTMTSIRISITN